jgi:hypothetical protein
MPPAPTTVTGFLRERLLSGAARAPRTRTSSTQREGAFRARSVASRRRRSRERFRVGA